MRTYNFFHTIKQYRACSYLILSIILLASAALILPKSARAQSPNTLSTAAPVSQTATDHPLSLRISAFQNGDYKVECDDFSWAFRGNAPTNWSVCKDGSDSYGEFSQIDGVSRDDSGYSESIKLYPARQIIVFTLTATKGSDTTPPAFPNFTELPPNLHVLSYSDSIGAKAQFAANQTSTPWIFFNDQANSLVISPASNFLLARMCGDAQYNMGVELNSQVKQTSPGFTQSAVMVFGRGMVSTMRAWGQQLAKLKNANDQTGTNNALLTSLGYWSDDAISFDPNLVFNKGYSNNVKTNLEKWRTAGANFGYLELGSWWYPKAGVVKNDRDRLTVLHDAFGWRGIDGVWSYSSSRESLPEGLDPLSRHTDLPLIATGGWIAQESPYRQTYKISGVAPIDSRYWENLSSQLVSQGITCYKQSQLSDIYVKSPAIGEIPGVGDSFTDGMANSFAKRGAALMYDQATPRFFLQAMRYGNIAAIGVSSGALNMDKWSPALYSTILARSAQTRPWLGPLGDIDQKNLLFDLLSGGPIGVMRSPKRSDAGFADGARSRRFSFAVRSIDHQRFQSRRSRHGCMDLQRHSGASCLYSRIYTARRGRFFPILACGYGA
jgi:hypothetical protein